MKISDVRGVIFDVDDTLLNNHPEHIPMGLHEHSRLSTAHDIGKRRGIKGLQNFTIEQSFQAFREAQVHSVHGAIWQMLVMVGQVTGKLDYEHPLLQEMVDRKEEIHEEALRIHGREVPGASRFIKMLAEDYGLADHLAIASTASRRDIDLFFEMNDLHKFFPPERVISREQFTHAKPHPEAYELAFKTLKLKDKKGVIAFEDDPRGIQSAKDAGLYTCAITTRFPREELNKHPIKPDLIADSYQEFAHLLGIAW